MAKKIVTLGVYGFDEEAFFQTLVDAEVDTFCDLRLRRGMRGAAYAFANRTRLEQHLRQLGIRYFHFKELAPSKEMRNLQKRDDLSKKIPKRSRGNLSQDFIQDYEEKCLASWDWNGFIRQLGPQANVVALFCVERLPEACHRSLVAQKLSHDLGIPIQHLMP